MIKKLTARWVVGYQDDTHATISNGEVLFENDTIVRVGPASKHHADLHHDCGNALLAPGFIDLNALADLDATILGFRRSGDPRDGVWSRKYAEKHRHDVLTLEERLDSARHAFGQLLRSGITTALPVTSLLFREWAEDPSEFRELAALGQALGLRLYLGPSYRSAVNVIEDDGTFGQYHDEPLGEQGIREAESFARTCGEIGPLVFGLLVPSTIDTCSDTLLRRTADAARELAVPYRLHCCQSVREARIIWERSGRSSIDHLADLGVLGEQALLPHAMILGGPRHDSALVAQDIDHLTSSGSTVVHCPLVMGRNGQRLQSFDAFERRGIRLGIGTDTAPPDMLMNLQSGLSMSRTVEQGRTEPAALFDAATLGGARALGRPDLGRLQSGARADMVAWDLGSPDMQPLFDPIDALFLMPPGRRARSVWVDGRRVVEDFRLVSDTGQPTAERLETLFMRMLESYRERHWRELDWREIYAPALPAWTG